MNPWINFHHLFYFKTIAEEGSVSKAALKLRLGQPTLSAQLKQFEESLGLQLFERQHKKLIITEQGRIALDYARSIFKLGSEMYEVLHDRIIPTRPSLHIGALDSIAKQVVVQLAQSAIDLTPCQIKLSEGKSDELLRELGAHRIDLLLTNFLPTGPEAKGLHHRVISEQTVSIFAAPRYKFLRRGFPKSISGQPLILPSYDSKLRYDLEHWASLNDVAFDVLAEGQDIATKKLMAISGLGLLPAALHTVNRQMLSGELLELGKLSGVRENLLLVTASRRVQNPIAAKLSRHFSL